MKTNPSPTSLRRGAAISGLLLVVGLATLVSPAQAQAGKRTNPASKVYVSEVSGEAILDTGESIVDLVKRSVYSAQGTVIETKKPAVESDRKKYFTTMVYSNGTGAFFDADTRMELKRFMQEPFTPNRTDMEVEPSISQTQAYVSRGIVGLCTSKLVAGSNMTYNTPLGSVNIRGRKVVIESGDEITKISMLEGDATVRAGKQDSGGHMLRAGEQAIIRRSRQGEANEIEIRRIPREEEPQLAERVLMACAAKKTVYFEAREKRVGEPGSGEAAGADDSAAGSGVAGSGSNFAPVTAFDSAAGSGAQQIVAVEILPTTLPTEYTVSNANLTSTPGR